MTITLTLGPNPEEEITAWCIARLRAKGFHVSEPHAARWESPKQAGARLQVHPFTVTKRIHRWEKMGNSLPVRAGRTGRIIEFSSDPNFDAFVLEVKR